MTYSITPAQFAKKLTTIKASAIKMRDEVQDALVAATYLCIAHSGGTTPMQHILDAVGNAAHRQGISTWLETYAPVRFVNDKILLHKDNWSKLDKEAALADFDKHMADLGALDEGNLWYQIAKEHNVTPSIFDPEKRINALLKALDSHECGTLASYIREAVDKYNAAQDLADKVVANMAKEKVEVQ